MNSMNSKNLKVAIVHDWLTGMRGGEKCLEVFCEMFPNAPIYTLVHNKGKLSNTIENHKIITSFIQKLPFANKHHQWYLPLFPSAIEQFDLREYDLVLSTSHCVAKGIITAPRTIHICYCHTPMRYAWEMYNEYFSPAKLNFIKRILIPPMISYLRLWDVVSANRVDYFIANSNHVAKRIKKYYHRSAKVIYPPVETNFFTPSKYPLPDYKEGGYKEATLNKRIFVKGEYFLTVSALVPYKRLDIAVRAFNELKLPFIIIGDGAERKKLERLAKSNIIFIGWQDKDSLLDYYQNCKAFIFPGEEDFGITPLEAQATGNPVIAYKAGGALETVIENKTGLFFYPQTTDALIKTIEDFNRRKWDSDSIRQNAMKFSRERFYKEIEEFISQCYFNQVEHKETQKI